MDEDEFVARATHLFYVEAHYWIYRITSHTISTGSKLLLSAALPARMMIQAQDAPMMMMDIPTTAIMAGNFGSLVASLSAANLVEGLSAPNGPFTVLAPTDQAFADLPMGLVDCLLLPESVETLTSILTYHVMEGSVASEDIEDEFEASTLNPDATLLFEVDEDEILVNDVEIIQTNIATSNGIIHVIEEVLVPDNLDIPAFLTQCQATMMMLPDIPTTAVNAGIFDTLAAALGAANLTQTLADLTATFTVMAPIDDAFAALPDGLVDCLLLPESVEALQSILLYHVLAGNITSADLFTGLTAPTLLDPAALLSFNLTDGVKVNDIVNVTQPDVFAENGVIHIIDQVLLPPGLDVAAFLDQCPPPMMPLVDIPTTAVNAGIFETLVAALGAANLVTTLADASSMFTVFAPTDDAFAALPDGLVDCLLLPQNVLALESILLYHVLAGNITSADLSTGLTAATLSDPTPTLTFDLTDGVKVNGIDIIQPDVFASNGVIHIIDGVLVPPDVDVPGFLATCPDPTMMPAAMPTMMPVATPTMMPVMVPPPTMMPAAMSSIVDIALADPELSILVDVLVQLNMVNILSRTDIEFTILAPTNKAFAAIADVIPTLTPEELRRVVLYHILPNVNIKRSEFQTGAYYPLNNVLLPCSAIFPATFRDPLVFVGANGARIIGAAQMGSNGIVHKLDKVMIPPPPGRFEP